MRCPNCSGRLLSVEMSFRGMVSCSFGDGGEVALLDSATATMDSEWNDSSRCECLVCGWEGMLHDARPEWEERSDAGQPRRGSPPTGRRPSPRTKAVDLLQINELLKTVPCNPYWQLHIEDLMAEVEHLRALVDMLARLSASPDRGDPSNEDTILS